MKTEQSFMISECPCGSGSNADQCCLPYIEGRQAAPTAEALMRSRYTAFTQNNEDYLRYSWHPDYCPSVIHIDQETRWLGLKIKAVIDGRTTDNHGEVEFVARFKRRGKASRIHEHSQFERYQGRWVYLTGEHSDQDD
jgi:SEC-C motif-containing protein